MLAAFLRRFRKAPAEPRWIDVAGLRQQLADALGPLVVDVRGPDEFDGPLGHIEGARCIPLSELAAHQGELAEAGRPIVFVCLTDKRSSAAAAQFVKAGFGAVAVLRGGMKAWRGSE